MRHRNSAIVLTGKAMAAFAFFVPVVYEPPLPQLSECPLVGFSPNQPTGAHVVSITYVYTWHSGTYRFSTYEIR